jgi:hypothetical protein
VQTETDAFLFFGVMNFFFFLFCGFVLVFLFCGPAKDWAQAQQIWFGLTNMKIM